MAASVKRQVERELVRLLKSREVKTKDKLEAARMYIELTGKRVSVSPPAVPVPEKLPEPSSLE